MIAGRPLTIALMRLSGTPIVNGGRHCGFRVLQCGPACRAEESEGGKALHELLSVFGAGKTLEDLLEHQSRGEDLLSTLEGDHLRHAWLAITAKGQRPDRGVDQQAHRWRSRSVL